MTTRLMTAETLNALKGWPQQSAVDFEAHMDSAITDRVPAGACVSLNTSLRFVLGCDDASGNPMPMFLFHASDDPDVALDAPDPSTEKGVWVPISATGVNMALVAVGAYELVSTNWDTTIPAASYLPNLKLTSPMAPAADAGVITLGTLGTNVICGVVSRGVVNNGYGTDALAFWPWFGPVYPALG